MKNSGKFLALAILLPTLSFAASPYNTIRGFAGGPNDAGMPWYGSSLINSGSTLFGITKYGGSRTNGALFKMSSSGSGFQILHSFAGFITGIDPNGSKNDGAYACGTPVLSGSTLYGMTTLGGSNGLGVIYSINTDSTGFRVLHHFGDQKDGYMPNGSLILSGTTLYGMTVNGGRTNSAIGTIFKIDTSGSGYEILYDFNVAGNRPSTPQGSLLLSGTTLYGMTEMGGTLSSGAIFSIDTSGNGFQTIHNFTGIATDGASPKGSLILSGSTLYGMTYSGGASNAGTVFQIETNGSAFQIRHSFALNEGYFPYGDLTLLNSTFYGMTKQGVTNTFGSLLGSGAIFKMNPDGSGYQILHTFLFPISASDGSSPSGSLLPIGSTLYGMTVLGGSSHTAGCVFSYALQAGSVDTTDPTLTIKTPTANQKVFIPAFNATGTAADSTALAGVFYQLNGGLWQAAGGTPANWSAPLILAPGPNVFSAYSIDASGNTSKTNSVTITYVLTDTIGVNVNGAGSVSPSLNGQALQIGATFKIAAKAATGSRFVNWTSNLDGVLTNNAALTFIMQSNLVLTANFADSAVPTLVVTSPKTGLRTSNELFIATGTAKDNFGVAGVVYRLNGSDWTAATTGNNWTNWSAPLTLVPGTNVLIVNAFDYASNNSVTNTLKLVYVLSAPMSVQIVGKGTVTPNYNGKLLALSNNYFMTAKAASGFAFSGWSGDIVTNAAKITFMMRSNLSLTASFTDITRPVNVFTVPGVGKTVTNSPFTAAGKGKDNVGITEVRVRLNDSGWGPASSTNAFTNWTIGDLSLLAGANIIQTFALDDAGNKSLTNTVKFTYKVVPVADWAPDNLNGLLVHVQPASGLPENVTFGLNTFAQAGATGDTNSDDYSVGTYEYVKTSTNTAQLTLVNVAPLDQTNGLPNVVDLLFTNHYSASFTNGNGDSGTFSAAVGTTFAPATVSGKKLVAKRAGTTSTRTIALAANGTFTKTPANGGGAGSSVGNYSFTRFSPASGMVLLDFSGADDGTLGYIQLTFTSATAGSYMVSIFDNTGARTDTEIGTFTLN